MVLLHATEQDRGSHGVDVRPSGRFVVDQLLPGEYTLALAERSPRRTVRITVIEGQRTQVRIDASGLLLTATSDAGTTSVS